MLAQGNALGPGIKQSFGALKGLRLPDCYETRSRVHKLCRVEISCTTSCGHDRQKYSFETVWLPPPLQGGQYRLGRYPRGVAPGWHPPRRWRETMACLTSDRHLWDRF